MKKIIKWLLVIVAVLLIGLAIIIFNPSLLKGVLASQVSRITGYSLALNGDFEVTYGARMTVSVKDIQLSNPHWKEKGYLLGIDKLYLEVDRATLFKDVIVIESLQVTGLNLNLESNEKGVGNWVIEDVQSVPETADSDDVGKPFVVLGSIKLIDANVVHLNGENGEKQQLGIESLGIIKQDSGMMDVSLSGSLNGRKVIYAGDVGPRDNLLTGRDVRFTGDGYFGSLKITGNGVIDHLRRPFRPLFSFDLEGPDIDEITAMFGIDDLGAGVFSISASGEVINDRYHAGVHGNIGGISLNISANASDIAQISEIDLKLAANGPSLNSVTSLFGLDEWPDKPFTLKGQIKRKGANLDVSGMTLTIGGTRLLLDAALKDFPHIDASQIDLSIKGDDIAQFRELLGISGIASGPFSIQGRLAVSEEDVELIQIEGMTSLGQVTLSGTLGQPPSYHGTALHVHLDGQNARTFMSAIHIDALPAEPFSLDTRVEWQQQGLQLEQGVLVTSSNERLEFDGLVAIKPGGKGTDLNLKLSGTRLAQMLGGLVGSFVIPDQSYGLSGRLLLQPEGVGLQNISAEFNGNKLTSSGLITLGKHFLDTGFDFQIEGENLSSLRVFPMIADSVDIFVTGQSYQARGAFRIEDEGFRLNAIRGKIGGTGFSVDGILSPQDDWMGSIVGFSFMGPAFGSLIKDFDASDLPLGKFKSEGEVSRVADKLLIRDFSFDASTAHGDIDLELAWPLNKAGDVKFDIDVRGDDIRHYFPPTEGFEPARAAYRINTVGQRSGDSISLDNFKANIGNLQVILNGKLNNDLKENDVDIKVSVVSKDISVLGKLNGEPLPPTALSLEADFQGNAREFAIRNLKASLGESQAEGSVEVALKGVRPKIDLALNSSFIDIRPYLPPAEDDEDSQVKPVRDRLIPDLPTPLDELALFDGDFKISIDEIRHRHSSLRNFELEAALLDDHLKISKMTTEGHRGKANLTVSIEPAKAGKRGMDIDFTTRDLLLNLSGVPEHEVDKVPTFDIWLNGRVYGDDLQELAGSMNGSLMIGSEGGTLKDVDLSLLDATILDSVFSAIIPDANEKGMDQALKCAATIMDISDGLVKTEPSLAFTTDRMALVAKGTLDLKTEKMAFNFNATPTNILTISASELINPYILVSGTLTKPVVGVDQKMALLHGGATIGTLGAYALVKGLADRAVQVVPPCQEMLKQMQKRR